MPSRAGSLIDALCEYGTAELTQPRKGGGGGLGRAVPRCRHIGCVVSHGAAAVSCCVVLCYAVLCCVGICLFDFCSLDHMMICLFDFCSLDHMMICLFDFCSLDHMMIMIG